MNAFLWHGMHHAPLNTSPNCSYVILRVPHWQYQDVWWSCQSTSLWLCHAYTIVMKMMIHMTFGH